MDVISKAFYYAKSSAHSAYRWLTSNRQAIPGISNELAIKIIQNLDTHDLNQFALSSYACHQLKKESLSPYENFLQRLKKEYFGFFVAETKEPLKMHIVLDNAFDNPLYGSPFLMDEEIDATISLDLQYMVLPGFEEEAKAMIQLLHNHGIKNGIQKFQDQGFLANWRPSEDLRIRHDKSSIFVERKDEKLLTIKFGLKIETTQRLMSADEGELKGIIDLFNRLETIYKYFPNLCNKVGLNLKEIKSYFGITA